MKTDQERENTVNHGLTGSDGKREPYDIVEIAAENTVRVMLNHNLVKPQIKEEPELFHELWRHLYDEHNLLLLDSELNTIINLAEKVIESRKANTEQA